ncbi:MAG: ferritin-like domain-containing protein [Janthinobacterium lividum]
MNLFTILSQIEQVDPEVFDRLDARRRVFQHLAGAGQRLAAAALPLAAGAIFNKTYAQTPSVLGVNDILNFALKLEYLEMYFYQQRTTLVGISSVNAAALSHIATDETNHVAFLRSALGSNAIAAPAVTQFDFTGGRGGTGGPFSDYRTNPATYLALAESLEDTGIRAYKGAAPLTALMANKTVLTAALGIHAVEARHSAQIRAMRRAGASSSTPSQAVAIPPYGTQPKSWISGIDNGGAAPAYTAPVYGAGNNGGTATYGSSAQIGSAAGVTFPAEDNATQAGVSLLSLPNVTGFPTASFSEAFDEGLDVGTVSAIARTFTIASSTLFS